MNLELLSATDPRWLAFLKRVPHQFYHLPGYAQLWADRERACAETALAVEGDDYFFLPYMLQNLGGVVKLGSSSEQFWDLCSPYGYPGPLIRAANPDFLPRAIAAWVAALRERQIVCGFVRLDPLSSNHFDQLAEFGHICFRGETVSVDLTASSSVAWYQIRPAIRRNIKNALRAGLTFKMEPIKSGLDTFLDVYYENMDRVGAADSYYFSREHFQGLAALLDEHLLACTIETPQGETVAAALLIEYGSIAQVHLLGTREAGLPLHAAKFMFYSLIAAARSRGNRTLHLGGGRHGAFDSLFRFKAGFSKRRHKFATWHVEFLPDVYKSIVAQFVGATNGSHSSNSSNGTNDENGSNVQNGSNGKAHIFFPAYRSKEPQP